MTDKTNVQTGQTSRLDAARTATADAYATAREKVGDTLHDARDAAGSAIETAREKLDDAGRRVGDGVEGNPWVALIGGIAFGALAAALLPRTAREDALFGTLGRRLNDAARQATDAARLAGQDKLDELGLNKDNARETVGRLFGDVAKAATEAGRAGLGSVKANTAS